MTRLTKEQAAIIGAYTGITCGNFGDIHAYVEKKMGRPVFTHEMGIPEFHEKIKKLCKEDFLAICNEEK